MEDRVKQLMAQQFKVELESITPESSPDNIRTWDSVQHMQLIIALEKEFNLQFPDYEVAEMISYRAVMEALERNGAIA